MKDFFTRHRHLIVISLIVAVILAALTPLVVPLGLELDERIDLPELALRLPVQRFGTLNAKNIQYYTVDCRDPLTNLGKYVWVLRSTQRDDPSEIAALCQLLNEAPVERNKQNLSGEVLCQFYLVESNSPLITHSYFLRRVNNSYILSGRGRLGGTASWFISDETAQTLLTYCYCSKDWIHNKPPDDLCHAENLASASLLTWEDREKSAPLELSYEQIEIFCAFLEEEFLTARHAKTQHPVLPHGENGWQVTLSMQDGLIWQVQYNTSQNCLSLYCTNNSASSQKASIGYTCKDKSVLAALPELLATP